MSKYTLKGANRADNSRCMKCDKKLDSAKTVWLELDQRYDVYHDFGNVPESHSQGSFPFGLDCAKTMRAEAVEVMPK